MSRQLSSDQYRKEKELRERRKAGEIEAEKDEEGKDINPHIPQFIADAPWYFKADGPTLRHQRNLGSRRPVSDLNAVVKKGVKGPVAKTYRKGACENCGAITHLAKDCTERPRRIGAKFTRAKIAPDEVSEASATTWEGKRDRWAGYDASRHVEVVQRYEKMEEERKRLKNEALAKGLDFSKGKPGDSDSDSDAERDEDEMKESGDHEMTGTKFDEKNRTSIRNLRLREDTAKYLYDLDPNSADHYDPKSRSMRLDPSKIITDEEALLGENFVRSGDMDEFTRMERFADDSASAGMEIPVHSVPTQAKALFDEFVLKKKKLKELKEATLLQRYGGEEYRKKPEEASILLQTDRYVEYSPDGEIKRTAGPLAASASLVQSRYDEDIFPMNHKSVWGSFWENGKWGYACCHQLIKNAVCTGSLGRERLPQGSSECEPPVKKVKV